MKIEQSELNNHLPQCKSQGLMSAVPPVLGLGIITPGKEKHHRDGEDPTQMPKQC